MTLDVFNTQDWQFERVSAYGKDITAALKKLVDRFPRDVTLKSLGQDILNGRQQLWLILDDEKFVSIVLTEIKNNEATGNKSVLITGFAGEEGISTVPLIVKIEQWAWENGADEVVPVGRFGWGRILKQHGYEANSVLYRKARPNSVESTT